VRQDGETVTEVRPKETHLCHENKEPPLDSWKARADDPALFKLNRQPAAVIPATNNRVTLIVVAFIAGLVLTACASRPTVSVSQPLAKDADVPYEKTLVVALFSSFDARRYLEKEIVKRLEQQGVAAVRSTSMMDTTTPVTAATFIDMVEQIDADSVLVTQLTAYDMTASAKDARPKSSWNYRPTYYYNVFEVELTEYVEPKIINMEHDLLLATQLFSVRTREPVWGVESHARFEENVERGLDYRIFEREADAIVARLVRDGVVAR
jgi:hypothetical protein